MRPIQIPDSFKYVNFLRELIARDFKKKYYKSFLGVLWAVLRPVMTMLVMTCVFTMILKRDIPHFPVYLMCGTMLFGFFTEATSLGLHSVVDSADLIKKVHVPKYIFCISRVLLQLVNTVFTFVPLVALVFLFRMPLAWTMLLIPIPLALITLFSLGVALALSAMAVYFRDLFHLYGIVTQLWMYLTPLFYTIDSIPEPVRFLWNYNPMYHYVTFMRDIVYLAQLPSASTVWYCLCYTALALGFGCLVFERLEKNFMLHL